MTGAITGMVVRWVVGYFAVLVGLFAAYVLLVIAFAGRPPPLESIVDVEVDDLLDGLPVAAVLLIPYVFGVATVDDYGWHRARTYAAVGAIIGFVPLGLIVFALSFSDPGFSAKAGLLERIVTTIGALLIGPYFGAVCGLSYWAVSMPLKRLFPPMPESDREVARSRAVKARALELSR